MSKCLLDLWVDAPQYLSLGTFIFPKLSNSYLYFIFYKNKNIIANANCSTIQLVLALKPLHDQFKIKRVVVSTYQSVSGAGKNHMTELEEQSKLVLDKQKVNSKNLTKQIAFNVIPHIDSFMEDGYTKEEWKMTVETKKILDPNIVLSATCVRVPVFVGHSESVNIEFNSVVNAKKIRQCLEKAPGCKVVDETKDGGYITPVESSGDFVTYISRIRDDKTQKNSINMWVVSDNLLKGAALNAVQIANVLIKKYIYLTCNERFKKSVITPSSNLQMANIIFAFHYS